MNDMHQFQMLMRKQLAIQEGIEMLKQIKTELVGIEAIGNIWGAVAVTCRAVMIPLNVIVNAGQLGTAKRMLGVLGEQVAKTYQKHGASGTGLDGSLKSWEGIAKLTLSTLKAGAVAELKQKGLTHYVPGANILIGLSEDSLALAFAMQSIKEGNVEFRMAAQRQQAQLTRMERELVSLGILANQHLGRMQTSFRTA